MEHVWSFSFCSENTGNSRFRDQKNGDLIQKQEPIELIFFIFFSFELALFRSQFGFAYDFWDSCHCWLYNKGNR